MIKDLAILVCSAVVIVAAVRFLLIPGIGKIGAALKFSPKVRGQMIGYATSIPELTVLVAGAFAGVFSAGLWNIASSNIINAVLFFLTVLAIVVTAASLIAILGLLMGLALRQLYLDFRASSDRLPAIAPGLEPVSRAESLDHRWHLMSAQKVEQALRSDLVNGLSQSEAADRYHRHGPNRLAEKPAKSPWLLLFSQFQSILILVLIATGL